jgi:presenilin-like A22 family membrane protease
MTILSFAIGTLLTFMIFYKKLSNNILIKNTGLMIFGALIGAFLGLVLPTWTSFLLLIGLSIYDVFAVFKGPIKKILELEEKNNQNFLEIRNKIHDYEIGLGDLTFYSMLVCATLKIGFDTEFIRVWGPFAIFLPCLVSIIGILMGALITFKLLEKKEMLPGLPISILLGIGLFGLVLLVFWLI